MGTSLTLIMLKIMSRSKFIANYIAMPIGVLQRGYCSGAAIERQGLCPSFWFLSDYHHAPHPQSEYFTWVIRSTQIMKWA